MAYFEIEGGHRLKGEIIPQGAKNEALQIIAAVLLTEEEVIINNIPDILDVNNLILALEKLSVKVKKIKKGTFSFCSKNIDLNYLESDDYRKLASKLRGSILLLGPLMARFKKAVIVSPGGDKIGRRKIDTHILGLEDLGAKFNFEDKLIKVEADKLTGCYMHLEEASVTATGNIIMAASLAEGKTTIYNAACEPYIQQLCKMLNSMGAKISGISSNLLTIQGVEKLGSCEHTILPDMIEIGSFIGLAAMTKSEITIKNVSFDDLGIMPKYFQKMGIQIIRRGDDIFIPEQESYEIENFLDGSILTVSDAIWPGLTPDLLSVFLVVAIQAKGSILIHQKMFESRLFFVDKLIDMGAKIILCDPHRATIIGINNEYRLKSTNMSSPDIRAGVALLIAALSAKGTSRIDNIDQIDRGYEEIDKRLRAIGAKIVRKN
jgi:UDP-N-acetylglucosamine 1-carboxyvinyltransferase